MVLLLQRIILGTPADDRYARNAKFIAVTLGRDKFAIYFQRTADNQSGLYFFFGKLILFYNKL